MVRRMRPQAWMLVLALIAPAIAQAQTDDPDALIQQGLDLRREHRDDEALAVFRRSHELRPSARALAQIALAEQATGRWVDAREHLTEALAMDDPWIAERRGPLGESL